MFKKLIAATAIVMPLVAAAPSAQAGSTITDKSYWPNEARTSRTLAAMPSNSAAAYASDVYAPTPSVPPMSVRGNIGRYQGGPKGR